MKKDIKKTTFTAQYNHFNEIQIRQALTAACMSARDGRPNYYEGGCAIGCRESNVRRWYLKYPEIVAEIELQFRQQAKEAVPNMIANMTKAINLGVLFALKRLESCFDAGGNLIDVAVFGKDGKILGYRQPEKLFEIIGLISQFIEKRNLLEGKPTGNERPIALNFSFGAANLATKDGKNRLSEYGLGG